MLENAEANRHAPPTSIGSVSDGVRAGGLLFVGEPHSPDTAGDLAFETAHGLFVGLALADLAVVVAAAFAVGHADLGHRDDVQRRVELAVAAA